MQKQFNPNHLFVVMVTLFLAKCLQMYFTVNDFSPSFELSIAGQDQTICQIHTTYLVEVQITAVTTTTTPTHHRVGNFDWAISGAI